MMLMQKLIVLIVLIGFATLQVAGAETIKHIRVVDKKEQILLDLLKVSLLKVDPSFEFEPLENDLTSIRAVEELKSGGLTVFWAGVTTEYEDDLSPIHIPVLKGMLGHRIFIIEKGKQTLFDNVNNLDDLKKLKAGQGKTWGDTKALLASDIPTVTTLKYKNLFPMLEGDRFDYFPRAIHEPWSEIEARPELNLTVENRLVLLYPFAMYFYVSKDNQRMHDMIYKGMEMAIADGSYDRVFYGSPLVKDAMAKANLNNRIVIRIPNPVMGPKTPFDRKEFWLDLENL